jgi:hypothetical protein
MLYFLTWWCDVAGARGGRAKSPRHAAGVAWLSTSGAAVIVCRLSGTWRSRHGRRRVRVGGRVRAGVLDGLGPNLKFWCRVADVDMHAILRTYCQGGKVARRVGDVEPTSSTTWSRRLSGPSRKVHGEQARNKASCSGSRSVLLGIVTYQRKHFKTRVGQPANGEKTKPAGKTKRATRNKARRSGSAP